MFVLKNKLFFSICLISLLSINCKNNNSIANLPIAEEKLVEVLCDVHIAEAMLDTEATEVRDSILNVYYGQIMEKHQIKKIDFDSSLTLLGRQPVVANRLLGEVQKKLKDLGK
jgi:hypothetical protein